MLTEYKKLYINRCWSYSGKTPYYVIWKFTTDQWFRINQKHFRSLKSAKNFIENGRKKQ